jgi:hypothetical protein
VDIKWNGPMKLPEKYKENFDVSSLEGPWSGVTSVLETPDEGLSLETSKILLIYF